MMAVYMIKANEDTIPDLRGFLESKGMICEVPLKELGGRGVSEIETLYGYCTGPLKEAILQITVEKLYDLASKNIGPVAIEQYAGKSQ